jgi:sodium transport system permease protein
MNLRQISIVYRKELLDALRDKRTIISTIVVPMVLFPLIFVLFGAVASHSVKKAQAEVSSVMILGAENAPDLVAKIRKAEGLKIVPPAPDYIDRIAEKRLRAAMDIPTNFNASVTTTSGSTNAPIVKIYNYLGEMRSQIAVRNLQGIIREHRNQLIESRLASKGLSNADLKPFETKEENVAPAEKVGGNLIGGIIPYMIIFLSFVGCIAPALDLTAGEKERGTIETILASPVGRTELVLGKFLLVVTTALITTIMALLSNAMTLALPMIAAREFSRGSLPFNVSGAGVFGVFILVFPLAIMFAAGQIAIASCARNYREAQSYISPLMMVVVLPAMAALLPGVDLNYKLALVPILNVSLVSKELLSGAFHYDLISIVFLSSCLYAMAALSVAIAAFKSESVLFRT